MNSRQRRIEIFRDTQYACLEDPYLAEASEKCRKHTSVIPAAEELPVPEKKPESCTVRVSRKRSFEAAEEWKDLGKVCVLNFASSVNPGGGVAVGSGAQEECLCRCSTLYMSLNDRECYEQFYLRHRRGGNPLADDDCIYTEGVCVFKTDTLLPERREKEEYFLCDVITCAAPDTARALEYGITVSREELYPIFRQRCLRILQIAALKGTDILILGAFGCGAFGNDPHLAAEAMKEAVQSSRKLFRHIEFAVYCPDSDPENYEVFRDVFASIK